MYTEALKLYLNDVRVGPMPIIGELAAIQRIDRLVFKGFIQRTRLLYDT